jgi:hypothetical protein
MLRRRAHGDVGEWLQTEIALFATQLSRRLAMIDF